MATGLISCGNCNCVEDIPALPDNGGQLLVDTSASGDYVTYDDTGANLDGLQIDVGDNPPRIDTGTFTDDAGPDDLAWTYDNALLDGYDGDWYVYVDGTPMVSVYAEFPAFPWSQTCSAVGETIPPLEVLISHVPVADLQDWIDAITANIKLTRLSDGATVPATVTPIEVPLCNTGGCRSPGTAMYKVELTPADPIADEWYLVGMDPVPAIVASAVDVNKLLRFNTGHDARVGMVRYQAQAGYDNQGSFNIVFTEMMHSPTLADFPTLRVAQGASSDLDCDYYTDDTMWLGTGEPQFAVRSCTGLDITQPFTIYLGGKLMTVDGKTLQPEGGEYQVTVQPTGWNAPCVDIWSCNEIPIP